MAIDVRVAGPWGPGCPANGVGDDTPGMQSIANYCAIPVNYGQEIFTPPGAILRFNPPGVVWSGCIGVRLHGESMFTQILDNCPDGDMFSFDHCSMFDIDHFNFDMLGAVVKTQGGYLHAGVGCSNMKLNDCRIIFSGYDNVVIQGGPNLGADAVAFYVIDRVTWLPGLRNITKSALRISRAADVVVTNVDCNYGQMTMVEAALVLDSGLDTAGFSNTAWSQIGGILGSGTGGRALLIQNTDNTFPPRFIRFDGVNAFESNTGPCIQIDDVNGIQFTALYSVTGESALVFNGGNVLRIFGGILGRCTRDVVQINGGKRVHMLDVTVFGGSQGSPSVYSGINVTSSTTGVKIIRPIIGDIDTGGPAGQMRFGILTNRIHDVLTENPEFGPAVDAPFGQRA